MDIWDNSNGVVGLCVRVYEGLKCASGRGLWYGVISLLWVDGKINHEWQDKHSLVYMWKREIAEERRVQKSEEMEKREKIFRELYIWLQERTSCLFTTVLNATFPPPVKNFHSSHLSVKIQWHGICSQLRKDKSILYSILSFHSSFHNNVTDSCLYSQNISTINQRTKYVIFNTTLSLTEFHSMLNKLLIDIKAFYFLVNRFHLMNLHHWKVFWNKTPLGAGSLIKSGPRKPFGA